MKTAVTQIQKTKEKFASNQQFIQQLGVSELEYKELILEVGCEFLQERYPLKEELYYMWYKEFAFSKSFWKWWQLEWNNWLSYLIEKQSIELKAAFPHSMRMLKFRNGTNESFNNQYLKTLHNGGTRI